MKKGNLLSCLYGMIILLILWHTLSVLWDLPVVPSPFDVIKNLVKNFYSKIMIHGLYSMGRILSGVFISIIIGVPIGLCMGYFSTWDKFLSPIIYLIYPIPKIALLPIVMLLFGLGNFSKIVIIVFIVIFQVIVAIRDGVKNIPEETYFPLYSLGAGYKDIFWEIILPYSLPKLFTALRIAMATSISILFFTETFGTEYGMGYFIIDAWMRINYIEMYAGIIILSLMGFLLFVLLDLLEKVLCPWRCE